ncbi:hypothetical protein N9Y30_01700 [Candidatus Pelagibacter bacterium]|jgi:hypothetical protein|nr:hypothetical protein [Candidatus Pelagibacter bacterium]MDB2601435.1 hypothetical protein [Candidatus Pelagibacter bacterium]|tara:strand:+ start:186 stop:566 length:381 start_codon:yes stop_codon:yes gene_type:complete
MTKSGIYLVQPAQSELKIIYNQKDAERAGDQSTILKVNKENIKFGQSNNFEKRYEEFKEIFGSDVRFLEVLEINDIEKLTEFKKHLKNVFNQYCLNSLKDGRKMDWMKSITLNNSQDIILEEYKKF